jgi:ABC-type nitrate/sulfonate/bicarbonate transport system substrate-binding protein
MNLDLCCKLSVLVFAVVLDSVVFFAAGATIRIGYPQPSGAMLPIWVMAQTKLDQKYGVDLQNVYIAGGARLTQTLVSGDIDLAATGGAVINAVLSGADLTYVAPACRPLRSRCAQSLPSPTIPKLPPRTPKSSLTTGSLRS